MTDKKKTTYTRMPTIPRNIQPLYRAVLEVQAGDLSVSEAARRLNLSRNRFQTRMHRGLEGLIEALKDRPTGRPASPPHERELVDENRRLRRENQRLHDRLDTIERLLGVAGEMVKDRARTTKKAKSKRAPRRRRKSSTTESKLDDNDDSETEARDALEIADDMRRRGLTQKYAATIAGVAPSTLRRWRRRRREGRPLREKRGPGLREQPSAAAVARVEHLVRETKGQAGADSLRHSVLGISRRQAARIKRGTLTDMERERIARAQHVRFTVPGVVRGFDAMHQRTTDGMRWPLIFADAAIPFRTTIEVAGRYDGPAVAAALRRDIDEYGAPLVYRADRFRAHDVPEVRETLEQHQVLMLHGLPRHPGYYGQLERQNREHRAWLVRDKIFAPPHLVAECDHMKSVLNELWRRPTLDWKTPSEAWKQRPRIDIDRAPLREEVQDRAARLWRQLDVRGKPADLAMRLAIEQALIERGLLRLQGGRC